jgi:endonuclease/exonuclease/phosphatase family metal-dependent hydrolase
MRGWRTLVALSIVAGACSDDTVAPKPDVLSADLTLREAAVADRALDQSAPAEPTRLVSYNAGLAAGAVPYAKERLPLIIGALKALDAEVLCLQEVWTDADAAAIAEGLKAIYPHSFREKTEDTSTAQVRCADPTKLGALVACRDAKCAPGGLSATACVTGPCKAEYDALTDACKLCLAGNTADPVACAIGGAKDFVYEGRNGLLLLSKRELKNAKYTALEAVLIKRGVITASVGALQVQCTHLPADFGSTVPYPAGTFTSWATEHAGTVDALVKTAASGCNVLLGDLNTGSAEGTLTGELPDNFKAFAAAGYSESWTSTFCTWCKENPLTGSPDDRRIDHILVKGCTKTSSNTRILDDEVSLQSGGSTVKTRLSDHYGVRAELK